MEFTKELWEKQREAIKAFALEHGLTWDHLYRVQFENSSGVTYCVDLSAVDPDKFMIYCLQYAFERGQVSGRRLLQTQLRELLNVPKSPGTF